MKPISTASNTSQQAAVVPVGIERTTALEQFIRNSGIGRFYLQMHEENRKHETTDEGLIYATTLLMIVSMVWVVRYLEALSNDYYPTNESGINTSMPPEAFVKGTRLIETCLGILKATYGIAGGSTIFAYICTLGWSRFKNSFAVTTCVCVIRTFLVVLVLTLVFYVTSFLLISTSPWAFIFILSFFNLTWLGALLSMSRKIHTLIKKSNLANENSVNVAEENRSDPENNQPETEDCELSISETMRCLPKAIKLIMKGIMLRPLLLGLLGVLTTLILIIEYNTVLIWCYTEAVGSKPLPLGLLWSIV
ncbi:hypothetical protein NEHOM01_2036 [Nematocida homosporus]|uniref:uncharacterized protein n=1 Tax=Nematocida homosporus TaxID=1912981 RepID=UPI00221F91F7|nr:uncharacterized protein NEHOM01_2036 [Nematocida homosporus]KAI5187240.1 hypothetical protein NEHOM01_2036 [Nematocida homosporus]